MTWELLNSLGRIALVLLAIYKIYHFRDRMIPVEQAGLCVMASGCLLTVPVIWERQGSPFEGWASSLMSLGMLVFIAGRTWRDRRHERANDRARAQAAKYMEGRR